MKERPILFSADMVRAIFDGRKTQTRRIVKPQPENDTCFTWFRPDGFDPGSCAEEGLWTDSPKRFLQKCPYGRPGDRLWVRETWQPHVEGDDEYGVRYRADQSFRMANDDSELHNNVVSCGIDPSVDRWRPAIHMFRWASRITLEVTDVRVEQLQDISRDDAFAEGVDAVNPYEITPDLPPGMCACFRDYQDAGNWFAASPQASFQSLWKHINGDDSWKANPWVWVVSFSRIEVAS